METFTLKGDNNRLYFKSCDNKNKIMDVLKNANYHMDKKVCGPSEDVYVFSKDNESVSLIVDVFEDDIFIYSEDGIDKVKSLFV